MRGHTISDVEEQLADMQNQTSINIHTLSIVEKEECSECDE